MGWDFKLDKAGTFAVELTFACEGSSGGSQFVVACGGQKLTGTVEPTGSWTKFARKRLGTIELKQPGKHTLTVKATKKPRMGVMNLRAIVLRPAK